MYFNCQSLWRNACLWQNGRISIKAPNAPGHPEMHLSLHSVLSHFRFWNGIFKVASWIELEILVPKNPWKRKIFFFSKDRHLQGQSLWSMELAILLNSLPLVLDPCSSCKSATQTNSKEKLTFPPIRPFRWLKISIMEQIFLLVFIKVKSRPFNFDWSLFWHFLPDLTQSSESAAAAEEEEGKWRHF